jgi:hypothetical protein
MINLAASLPARELLRPCRPLLQLLPSCRSPSLSCRSMSAPASASSFTHLALPMAAAKCSALRRCGRTNGRQAAFGARQQLRHTELLHPADLTAGAAAPALAPNTHNTHLRRFSSTTWLRISLLNWSMSVSVSASPCVWAGATSTHTVAAVSGSSLGWSASFGAQALHHTHHSEHERSPFWRPPTSARRSRAPGRVTRWWRAPCRCGCTRGDRRSTTHC